VSSESTPGFVRRVSYGLEHGEENPKTESTRDVERGKDGLTLLVSKSRREKSGDCDISRAEAVCSGRGIRNGDLRGRDCEGSTGRGCSNEGKDNHQSLRPPEAHRGKRGAIDVLKGEIDDKEET